jgi:hypothetical protein
MMGGGVRLAEEQHEAVPGLALEQRPASRTLRHDTVAQPATRPRRASGADRELLEVGEGEPAGGGDLVGERRRVDKALVGARRDRRIESADMYPLMGSGGYVPGSPSTLTRRPASLRRRQIVGALRYVALTKRTRYSPRSRRVKSSTP